MSTEKVPRDAGYWAAKVERLAVPDETREYGFTIEGRRLAGPPQGFGRLWQRDFWTELDGAVTPEALVADWRAHFGDFWPAGGRFHGALTGIAPGGVAPLEVGAGGGLWLTTGILVLYADETSFTFMTPEGHLFAAMITFSGEPTEGGGTRAFIRMMLRTSDPLFELGWPVIKRKETAFWTGTLRNLAASYRIPDAVVHERTECVDRQRIWRHWTNVRDNMGIRSVWHLLTTPFRPRVGAQPAA